MGAGKRGKRLETGPERPIFGVEPAISGKIPEKIRWKKDTTDAHRQAHHQVPAGPRRRPEPRPRPRQRFIEPQHLMLALLAQEDGGTRLAPAARRRQRGALRKALEEAVARLPKVEGHGGEISVSRDLGNLLNLTDKEARSAATSTSRPSSSCSRPRSDKGETGRLLKQHGATPQAIEKAIKAVRGGQGVREPRGRGQPRGAQEVHARPHRARAPGQARPGDRPRRRDPPRHPDPAAAHQEQPGAHRRARRGQDRDRRGPRAAHRQRRGARDPQGQARALARHGRRSSRAPSTAASSRSGSRPS